MKLQTIVSEELKRFELGGEPKFATKGSAAIDLRALLNGEHTARNESCDYEMANDGRVVRVHLHPGAQLKIDTGLRIHINNLNYCGLILPRSSAGKRGLVLANGVGLIDSDYQGPLICLVLNRTDKSIWIEDGERIAQYLLTNAFQFEMEQVKEFSDVSERGEGGYGSTGTK